MSSQYSDDTVNIDLETDDLQAFLSSPSVSYSEYLADVEVAKRLNLNPFGKSIKLNFLLEDEHTIRNEWWTKKPKKRVQRG